MKRLSIICTLLAASLAACSDMPVRGVGEAIGAEESAIIARPVRNAVDVLWVVDNSTSMRPFQLRLAADLPALASALAELNVDFNFAVVTVDIRDVAFRDRPPQSEFAARASFDPDFAERCAEPRGPVLSASDYRLPSGRIDIDRLQVDFACIAAVGEDQGAATERGLEVVQRALEASDTFNEGFLRDEALLVVIFISDEDDCSQAESANIRRNQCYMRSNYPRLLPVEQFEEALLRIKGADFSDPASVQEARDKILVLGLIGDPVVRQRDQPPRFMPTLVTSELDDAAFTCTGTFTGLATLPPTCREARDCGVSTAVTIFECVKDIGAGPEDDGVCGIRLSANSSYRYWDLMRRFVPSYRPPGAPDPVATEASGTDASTAAPESDDSPEDGAASRGIFPWEDPSEGLGDELGFIPLAGEQPWRSICNPDYQPVLRALAGQITSILDTNCLPTSPKRCESNADCAGSARCILPTVPDPEARFAGCPAEGFCEDFTLQIQYPTEGESGRFARGAISAGEYCRLFERQREITGGYEPAEDAEFYIDFRALRCPFGVGFNFTEGNQPGDNVEFRLRYPVSISDDF